MIAASKEQVRANVREMMSMAEAGYVDAAGPDPSRRRTGLMNLFTYGRTVTLTIQTMKSFVDGFDEWWKPYQAWMAGDGLMQYFNTARTNVIHEGSLRATSSTVIGANGPVDMGALIAELNKHAPPNTVGTFFGEGATGGDGWRVQMPNGTVETVYFRLPDGVDIKTTFHLPDPPTEHDGVPINDNSIANLGGLYMQSLRRIVSDFETKWFQ